MINRIGLEKIFRDTWGYIGLPFPEFITEGIPERVKNSMLGVPFYTKNSNGRELFMPIWLSENDRDSKEYLLPNTVMSLSNKKEIVTTKLVNRDGSVKEEISLNDWEIDIKGVLVSNDNSYPEKDFTKINEWFKNRIALNIQNARTAICLAGGEKVVITDLRFPEIRGFENTQPYELKLISDIEFSLYID